MFYQLGRKTLSNTEKVLNKSSCKHRIHPTEDHRRILWFRYDKTGTVVDPSDLRSHSLQEPVSGTDEYRSYHLNLTSKSDPRFSQYERSK